MNTRAMCTYWTLQILYTLCNLTHIQSSPSYTAPRHRPPGLYGHIFIAIACSNTNYVSPAATRLMWPMIRVGWRIFPSSAYRKSKTAIFNDKSNQINKAYHTHSSFLTKHHIDGIVAKLDVSNVDNVCVCLKRSDQFALKQGHLSMVPLTRGHLLIRSLWVCRRVDHIRSGLHAHNLQSTFSTTPLV